MTNPWSQPPQDGPSEQGHTPPPGSQPNPQTPSLYGTPPASASPYGAPPSSAPSPYGGATPSSPSPYTSTPQATPSPYGTPAPGQPGAFPQHMPAMPQDSGQYANPYGATPQWQASQPRPGGLTAGAVMTIVGGAIVVGLGLLIAILAGAASATMDDFGIVEDALWITVAVVVVMGVGLIALGALVMRGKFWALVVLTVLGALSALSSLSALVTGENSGSLLGIAYIGVALGLMYAPASRSWLRAQRGR